MSDKATSCDLPIHVKTLFVGRTRTLLIEFGISTEAILLSEGSRSSVAQFIGELVIEQARLAITKNAPAAGADPS